MSLHLRTLTASATAVLALTMAGCGSSSSLPDLDAGGDAKAASGAEIKGAGYDFHMVPGWKQSPDKKGLTQIDTLGLAPKATDGFTANVNVVVKKGVATGTLKSADFTKAEKTLVTALKGVGGTDLHVQPRLNLADETSLHITGNAKQGTLAYQTDQYVAFHKGTEYVVTFSFPSTTQESARTSITEPTMASWTWS